MKWEGTIGPATLIGVAQLLIFLIGGIITVTQMQNGIDQSRLAVAELKNVVSTLQTAQTATMERLGRLETSQSFVNQMMQRLEGALNNSDKKR